MESKEIIAISSNRERERAKYCAKKISHQVAILNYFFTTYPMDFRKSIDMTNKFCKVYVQGKNLITE
jgi:hypothetical protein